MQGRYDKFKRRPYGKRRFRRTLYRKPSTRRNRNNIYHLSKQVSSLSKQMQLKTTNVTFARAIVTQGIAYPYRVLQLTVPTQYSPIFALPDQFDNKRKWWSKKLNLDFTIQVSQEAQMCQYTAFIVSLKTSAANTIIQAAGEDLTSLQADVHYRSQSGKAMVNMNYFNIHWSKRLNLFTEDTVAGVTVTTSNKADIMKRYYARVPFRRFIKPGTAPSAFNNLPSTSMPDNAKLYLLIFTDDIAGAVNTISGNVLWTLSTV